MDSKTNPSDSSSSVIRLVFSKNNTLDVNLLVDGQIRYMVSTTDRYAQHTRVINTIAKTEIASVRKRTFLADSITFASHRGGTAQKLSDVLQQYKMGDGCQAYMIHTEKGNFHWRTHPVYHLALFSPLNSIYPMAYRESVQSAPIATFALVVKTEFEDMIDYIIPTFLVLERKLRIRENPASVTELTPLVKLLPLGACFGS